MNARNWESSDQEQGSENAVSILLTGAELAEFKSLSSLQLFWSQDQEEESGSRSQEVELRSKSGISVQELHDQTAAVPFFSLWNRSDGSCDGGYSAGFSSLSSSRSSKLGLEGFSASVSPISLKSRAVLQAEKEMKCSRQLQAVNQNTKLSKTKKQRAVSMDETSLSQLRSSSSRYRCVGGDESISSIASISRSSKDDLFRSSSRRMNSMKSEENPLPLPLPPPDHDHWIKGISSRNRHRRHLSIDLRASPAAKFLVQVMPWEIPCSLDEQASFTGRMSSSSSTGHCFVPFKWEEVPGKPKNNNNNNNSNNVNFSSSSMNSNVKKLRLPPRLQQIDDRHHSQKLPTISTSPTSTLDNGVVESSSHSSMDSSSSSSPNATEAAAEGSRTQKGTKIRAFLAWQIMVWPNQSTKSDQQECQEDLVVKTGGKSTQQQQPKMKHPPAINFSSWSPSPRSSWFQKSGLEIHHRMNRNNNWAFEKLANGCNVVRRAVRFRWWVCRQRGGSNKRKSLYKPLLCRVDGDSAAFACS